MWVFPTLPFQHCSLAPTGDASCSCSIYPQRKLPYPSACCVHCPIPVSGTRGTREQHQVLTVVVGHLLTSYQIVAGCREYLTGLVRVTPKVDAMGKRVGFAGIEAAVIPNPEGICRKMRLRILALHWWQQLPVHSWGILLGSSVTFNLSYPIVDRCRVGETDSSPQGVFVLGAPGPTCSFILVQEQWNLSEAEEWSETSGPTDVVCIILSADLVVQTPWDTRLGSGHHDNVRNRDLFPTNHSFLHRSWRPM